MNRPIIATYRASTILLACLSTGLAADAPRGPLVETRETKTGPAASFYRVWTGASGKFTVEAQLADFQDGNVRLRKKDAKTFLVPLEKLCKADRSYVDAWARLKNEHPWLDNNTPFDVVAFLQPIPDEENAALLYPDALFEFSGVDALEGHQHRVPSEEEKARGQIVGQRSQERMRLDEAWRKDPKSVNLAEVDACLAEYETGFRKLALAQKRPRCAFPCAISPFSLLGDIQATREVARVLTFRNRRDLARGDLERAIQGMESLLRLSRDIRYRGCSVTQLVSVSHDTICCDVMTREILLAPGLRREHCDRLLAALARHEAEGIDRFLEGQRVEYLWTRQLLYEFQRRTGAFDAQWLQKNLGWRQPVVFPITTLSLLGRGAGRLAREKYGSELASGKQRSGKAAEQWQHLMAMTAEDQSKDVDAVNRVYADILGLEGQTLLERSRACAARTLVEPLRDTYAAIFFEPYFGGIEAYRRTEALLGGTKCLIALRRWQLEHRELPPDLESLVKAAGMARVPNDPYCDQPLRMTAIQGEPVIYSVGKDGRDDKALSDWKNGTQPGDYIFRLVLPTN